jgi:hypothetical protein
MIDLVFKLDNSRMVIAEEKHQKESTLSLPEVGRVLFLPAFSWIKMFRI